MSDPLQIAAVGDLGLNAKYEPLVLEGKGLQVFSDVLGPLRSDLTIGNLENPLTVRTPIAPPWRYCMRGHPEFANVLKQAGFHVLSLANNHMMDYGWEAVEETVAGLKAVGIETLGVGRNASLARHPLILNVQSKRVGMLAYCSVSVGSSIYATETEPGVAQGKLDDIVADVKQLRPNCDLLVVCLHWGQEHVACPTQRQREEAKEFLASGADIVLGHHPHVLQGSERFGEGYVVYSLGNFTMAEEIWHGTSKEGQDFEVPFRMRDELRRTAILRLRVDGKKIAEELVPAYLYPDLLVKRDPRPERLEHFQRLKRAFQRPGYGVYWGWHMLRARMTTRREVMSANMSLGRRLLRLRPRHWRVILRAIAEEWRQVRGAQ